MAGDSCARAVVAAGAGVVAAGAASETRLADAVVVVADGAVVVEADGAVVVEALRAVVVEAVDAVVVEAVDDEDAVVDAESTSPRSLMCPTFALESFTSSVDSTDSPVARAIVIACCFGYRNSSPVERPG